MKAIYHAELGGVSSLSIGPKIVNPIDLAAENETDKKNPTIQSKYTDEKARIIDAAQMGIFGDYLFKDDNGVGCDVTVRKEYDGGGVAIEVSGPKPRVDETESQLLNMVDGLTLT